jgi:hypothetical protein
LHLLLAEKQGESAKFHLFDITREGGFRHVFRELRRFEPDGETGRKSPISGHNRCENDENGPRSGFVERQRNLDTQALDHLRKPDVVATTSKLSAAPARRVLFRA